MARKSGTTESFIEKAKAVHGERYDYSLVEYGSSRATVKVLCPDHGIFEQRSGHHLEGQGCPVCGNSRKTTKGSFVEKARKVHGDRYGYDAVVYSGAHTKVEILCHKPHHGLFSQRPGDHLQGYGCPKCSGVHPYSTGEFIEKARAVHGDKYCYDKSRYVGALVKITIFCKTHKTEFEQTPGNHLFGRGCPSCAESGYNPEKPGNVYLLVTPDSVKVGITNKIVQERVAKINSTTECKFNIERVWSFADGSVAPAVERVVLAMLRAKYKNPAKKFDGYTETFVTTDVSFVASTIDAVVSSINK